MYNKLGIPLFGIVLLVHLIWVKEWTDRWFVYYSNNTLVVLDFISKAHSAVVDSRVSIFDPDFFSKCALVGVGVYWPALVHTIGLLTLFILPVKWFFLLNIVFLTVIMLGIYCSTRILIGNKFYSMLAAMIFSFYWFVGLQLISFELQLAATACIVWSFYWYLRSSFFTRFWPSVMVGVFAVLALYCDRLSPVFFIIAFFLVPENFRRKKSLFFMVFVLAFVVVCAWPFYQKWIGRYIFSGEASRAYLFSLPPGASIDLPPLEAYRLVVQTPRFLFAHLVYYFIALPRWLIGYGFTAFLLAGLFFSRRLNRSLLHVIWIAILFPLVLFVFIIKKDYIYIFPLCVYFSIVTSAGVYFINKTFVRHAMIGLMIVFGGMQIFSFFYIPERSSFWPLQAEYFQGVPKLFYGKNPNSNVPAHQLFRMAENVSIILRKDVSSGEGRQAIIIADEKYALQNSLAFLLRFFLPKTRVDHSLFRSFYEATDICKAESLYLVSSENRYIGANAAKSVVFDGVVRCSWQEVEAQYPLGGGSVLYKLKR